MTEKIYLGLTGSFGSGCTELRRVLEDSYRGISLSETVREEAERQRVDQNRDTLQNVGNTLRRERGLSHLAKVAIQKAANIQSDIIIFDEPTHGIDVGAKADIYQLLRELSDEGKGIIMVSSELPEVLNVCDRILVFRDVKIVKNFEEIKGISEEDVVKFAIG